MGVTDQGELPREETQDSDGQGKRDSEMELRYTRSHCSSPPLHIETAATAAAAT
jgi:hypothetical protein